MIEKSDCHTFPGCERLCETDLANFTNHQAIGKDPIYKRYGSVRNLIDKTLTGDEAEFLARPNLNPETDTLSWYIPQWHDKPRSLASLTGSEREKYEALKQKTISDYEQAAQKLPWNEGQSLSNLVKNLDDNLIYCCDGKIYAVGWGMKPDLKNGIKSSQLVNECFENDEITGDDTQAPEPPEEEPPTPPEEPKTEDETPKPQNPKKFPWKWVILGLVLAIIILLIFLIPSCNKKGENGENNPANNPDSVPQVENPAGNPGENGVPGENPNDPNNPNSPNYGDPNSPNGDGNPNYDGGDNPGNYNDSPQGNYNGQGNNPNNPGSGNPSAPGNQNMRNNGSQNGNYGNQGNQGNQGDPNYQNNQGRQGNQGNQGYQPYQGRQGNTQGNQGRQSGVNPQGSPQQRNASPANANQGRADNSAEIWRQIREHERAIENLKRQLPK